MVEADEKTIRQYLLGELDEAEMVRFEERLMTDDELFEMLRVVEDELIDEAAARELSADEQARFDRNFLATPDRRARLELSLALHDYVAADPTAVAASKKTNDPVVVDFPPPKQESQGTGWPLRRLYWGLAAAAVILIAIGLGWWIFIPTSDVSKGLQALNQAYREQRPTEARITGLNYAPPPPVTRGPEPEKFDYVARDRAQRILQDAVAGHPDAQAFHALGQLYLANRQFDEAIKEFAAALKLNPGDAQVESDIGAAYLEKGKADRATENGRQDLADYEESLKHLTRALESDDSLLQARFNRALLYGYLNRTPEAQHEWRIYLKKERDPRWAEEATRRLEALEK
jgi:tetratricopeptide (TPR) repeat protein